MKINALTKLTNLKWINLFQVNYDTGKTQGDWVFASRKNQPVLGSNPIQADAVVIVPIYTTKENGKKVSKLVVTKEFRIPLGDYEYGLPAGLYDHNETAEAVAKRELKEETGLDLKRVLYVSKSCVSSAGLSDEAVVYVVCECTGKVSNDGNEATEDIAVELLDVVGISELRKSDNKISAKALPYLLMFEGIGKISWPRKLKNA